MADERVDRSLPADFMSCFLRAIAIEMGNYSLQLMLHQGSA